MKSEFKKQQKQRVPDRRLPRFNILLFPYSLEFLVGITGSYAGAGIQYIVPALLVYTGRKVSVNAIGVG